MDPVNCIFSIPNTLMEIQTLIDEINESRTSLESEILEMKKEIIGLKMQLSIMTDRTTQYDPSNRITRKKKSKVISEYDQHFGECLVQLS